MDNIDYGILDMLRQNSRAGYGDIGDRVGLSASAVKRRVDRLVADGVIRAFTIQVDPAVDGMATEAYVELFCRGKTSPAQIAMAVGRHPEVVSACTVTGEADALLHIRGTDMRHVEQVIERIAAEPFVVRTKSAVVLSRLLNGSPPSG